MKRTSRSDKVCPFCGVPFALTETRDRSLYDWYINKSIAWKSVREWALQRAGYKCEECGCDFSLQVHHKTYSRLGKEHPDDLIVLCQVCHELEHE